MIRIIVTLALSFMLASCMKWDGKKKYFSQAGTSTAESLANEVPTTLRRITKSQYLNTVRAALGADITSRTPLPDDPTKDELIAIATRDSVFSLRDAELYSNAGWDMAGQFVDSPTLFSTRFECACGDMTKACLSKGLDGIGPVLFHGQFEDSAFYGQLFDDVLAKLTKDVGGLTPQQMNCQGVRTVLAALIGSPRSFYYDNLLAFSGNLATDIQKQKFSTSLANQLSYFLWNSPPDRELMNLAESGALADPEARIKLIRSMVDNPNRFKAGMKALFDDWLAMHAVEKVASSTNAQETIAKAALVEFDFLVSKSVESTDFLGTFLTSNATVLDANLAAVYGVAANATTLSGTDRAGFLTRSAFLLRAGTGATSPTKRGHYIRGHFLCEDIPPPPPGLDLTNGVPNTDDKYQIIKARLDNPNCKGCHAQLDPLGIGLEGYGPNGQTIAFPNIATYQLAASVFDQPYSGGAELSNLLVKNEKVLACFAKNALRIGLGKKETPEEQEAIEKAVEAFQAGTSKSLNELIFHLLNGIM
ncbi:DUF1592 domain-containing protein [Oligoflexus sp.]|uniref:DUF1592 domain-containing protein n=1 Tax=Oligoflexus sp. TaxID=1971216 RepID=UPI002D76F737|nr:DUF1592 domain-containing protein [Oligoflexus sp.]